MRAARRFVREVQKEGIRLQKAYLYGSYATGRAHRGSDIDIALISPDFTGWIDDLQKIRDALRKGDPRIESVHLSPETFVDENPLVWEVKTKGISLLPPPRSRKRRTLAKRRARRTGRRARQK